MALQNVVWKALELFSHPPEQQDIRNNRAFSAELSHLIHLLSGLQLTDLRLTPEKMEWLKSAGHAPVWYMSIVDAQDDQMLDSEDEDQEDEKDANNDESSLEKAPASVMTVAAFAVKPGARLPIHDHPKMYGLLKVVHGEATVQSYSSVRCLAGTPPEGHSMPQLMAEKHEVTVVTARSDPLLLHKNHQDIHEIVNNSETTVCLFIDILSPPYHFRLPDSSDTRHGHRYITYYRELGPASPAVCPTGADKVYVILEGIKCPKEYKTQHIAYTGPSLIKEQATHQRERNAVAMMNEGGMNEEALEK
ncbi:hypothetical protein BV898_00287 [Hypsibius exemplaris]|uniref:2-aminoethanethiol dioxygenase n=1 Tax=Hypsibius exemplaris TaxID=2072580 RepID=A0A1W0XFH5_HYPEX|nr:hypothetical protein BV898_00287 [Hypsibius exemplaris]